MLQATTGAATVSYVPGLGQYDSSKPTEAEKWGYTLSDAQNARLLMDGAGILAHRWEWEPFGRARADQGATAAAFSYGGEQKDDETGLVNLRARYYDPGIGRFLSRDSLPGVMTIPQSWNRYSYVENDPINYLDPSGVAWRLPVDRVGDEGFSLSGGFLIWGTRLRQRAPSSSLARLVARGARHLRSVPDLGLRVGQRLRFQMVTRPA